MDYFLGELQSAENAILTGQEMHHCLKVLRHKKGDEIGITDGAGNLWICRIEKDDWKESTLIATVLTAHPNQGEDRAGICLICCGPEDPSRMEWLVEKSVELGVSQLFLVRSSRSGYIRVKINRLETIIRTALKQCGRSRLPVCAIYESLEEAVKNLPFPEGLRIVGAESGRQIKNLDHCTAHTPITICCGPEGDFTSKEMHLLTEQYQFLPVALGNTRLRSETACIALLSWAKSRRG